MEDEDDMNGGQRDVLDWCYVVTRVLVLFSVVYFYSSLPLRQICSEMNKSGHQKKDQNQGDHITQIKGVSLASIPFIFILHGSHTSRS